MSEQGFSEVSARGGKVKMVGKALLYLLKNRLFFEGSRKLLSKVASCAILEEWQSKWSAVPVRD